MKTFLILLFLPVITFAQSEVEITLNLPAEFGGVQAEWSAVPIQVEGPLDAWAPMELGSAMTASFLPGIWLVSADLGEDFSFEGAISVSDRGPFEFTIPFVPAEAMVAFEGRVSLFNEPTSGVKFDLPAGLTVTETYFYTTAGGAVASVPTVILANAGGEDVIWLNMRQISAMVAECFDTDAGNLCLDRTASGIDRGAFQIVLDTIRIN